MVAAASNQQQTSLRVERTVHIAAPIQVAYDSVIEILGPAATMPDGTAMPMKFEPRPGGRWFRDLGEDAGHLWGHVQVIKPPNLIEISGPLFMSYPAISHVQYRLTETDDGTTLTFCHRAIGELEPQHIEGVSGGWDRQLKLISDRAAGGRS